MTKTKNRVQFALAKSEEQSIVLPKTHTHTHTHTHIMMTQHSTEAELVAVDNAMCQVLWTRHFLVTQGHTVPTTTIYQDNKSTVLLAENGKL